MAAPQEPYDAPLTPIGMQQAADLGLRLQAGGAEHDLLWMGKWLLTGIMGCRGRASRRSMPHLSCAPCRQHTRWPVYLAYQFTWRQAYARGICSVRPTAAFDVVCVRQCLGLGAHCAHDSFVCSGRLCCAGLFPHGPPKLQQPAALAATLPRVTFKQLSISQLPPWPESYKEAKKRCSRTVLALADRHRGQSILLVGHGLSVEYLVRPSILLEQTLTCDSSPTAKSRSLLQTRAPCQSL